MFLIFISFDVEETEGLNDALDIERDFSFTFIAVEFIMRAPLDLREEDALVEGCCLIDRARLEEDLNNPIILASALPEAPKFIEESLE